jgi:hypothetical protein
MTPQPDWNKWLTLIAALTLVAAVILPFAQKKYEEWKAKISFNLYLKKYFGILYNILTYDKIEYRIPSVDDNPKKVMVSFEEYLINFESDYKKFRTTNQPRIAFSMIYNLQYLFLIIYRLQSAIKQVNGDKLYEQTLAYGNNLRKAELNKIYSVLLLMENFTSITLFHDRFQKLKSVGRLMDKNIWMGFEVNKTLVEDHKVIFDDLMSLNNNESSINEVITICKLMIQEFKSFYDFNTLQKKRKK